MALTVIILLFVALDLAALKWGVDSRHTSVGNWTSRADSDFYETSTVGLE